MPIKVPGKRYGKRLQRSKVFGHGHGLRKAAVADLLITPLVDMFVIIVLFLIANFSASGDILNQSKDIQLPTAAHVKELEDAPVVQVSAEKVIVDGSPIPGTVDELSREEYLNIPALEEKLRELKKTFEAMHSATDQKPFNGQVNIQGHKDVEFKIIKRIMFSCATAGDGEINFAVLGAAGPKTDEKVTASARVP